ncbi:MAG: ComEC/Rec2 family competence protein [Candidatus Roizmanbacteria bacterium]|nr:ComEC/Rec2 family competence protein [Candidatus Roizmanbacteria bacterium]
MNPGDILVRVLPGDHGSIAAALVWGQKQYLTPELYTLCKQAGVLHLAVLSGQNITLVSECLRALCSSVSSKITSVLTILIGLLYLLLLPHDPPIIRAVIMGSLTSLSILLGRRAIALYLLLVSGVIMITINSSWISDLSFLLSISATGGIILLYPWFKVKHKGHVRYYVHSTLATTISAQVGIVPITFLVFREYAPLSILSNILLIWLIEPIMMLGILSTLLEYLLPGGGTLIIPPLHGLTTLFLWLLSQSAHLSKNVILQW